MKLLKPVRNLFLSALVVFAVVACDSIVEDSPEQMAIESVYNLDSKICKESRSITEIVAKLQSIRLTGCPPSFSITYTENIRAWEKFAVIEKKMYDSNMQNATKDIEAFLDGYFENPTKSVDELKKKWASLASEIDEASAALAKSYAAFEAAGARFDVVYKKNSTIF